MLKKSLFPELDEALFQRFIRYSFIMKTGEFYQYHSILRQLITTSLLEQNPQTFFQNCETLYRYFDEQGNDERFYYGIYAGIEGIFEEWADLCYESYNTWQTDRLKLLVGMIDEIQQPFSQQEQSAI